MVSSQYNSERTARYVDQGPVQNSPSLPSLGAYFHGDDLVKQANTTGTPWLLDQGSIESELGRPTSNNLSFEKPVKSDCKVHSLEQETGRGRTCFAKFVNRAQLITAMPCCSPEGHMKKVIILIL